MPSFIKAEKHFGNSLKVIHERNEILLVTGKIDTTSESIAVAVLDGKRIMFKLVNSQQNNNKETTEEYSGDGYDLKLTYKEKEDKNYSIVYEGRLIIKNNLQKSNYTLVGMEGYN